LRDRLAHLRTSSD